MTKNDLKAMLSGIAATRKACKAWEGPPTKAYMGSGPYLISIEGPVQPTEAYMGPYVISTNGVVHALLQSKAKKGD